MKAIKMILEPTTKLVLPFAHFYYLQGVFYDLLSYDNILATEIHNKEDESGYQYKFFCFSDVRGKYHISEKFLVFDGEVSWEIRAADDRIITTVQRAIQKSPTIDIAGCLCRVKNCVVEEKTFYRDKVEFFMDTPIVFYRTENGYAHYFSPNDDAFRQGVIINLIKKYTAYYGEPPQCEIHFDAVYVKDKDKCVTRYKNSMITGYYGKYRLVADEKTINFAYYAGLGGKNAMGFGTISATGID